MFLLMCTIQIDTEKYLYLIEARYKIQCLRGITSINQLKKAVQAVLDSQCLNFKWSGPFQPMDFQNNWKCLFNWCLAGPVQWVTPVMHYFLNGTHGSEKPGPDLTREYRSRSHA